MRALRTQLIVAFIGVTATLVGCTGDDGSALPEPVLAAAGTGDHADAFGDTSPDGMTSDAMLEKATTLVKQGSVVQFEPRLGVPTFLWTRPLRIPKSRAAWLAAGSKRPVVDASRAALTEYQELYGLRPDDVARAVVTHVDERPDGPVIVKFHSEIGGIEVFREELSVMLDRSLEPIAISGYITSTATPAARTRGMAFDLDERAATAAALGHLSKTVLAPAQLAVTHTRDGYRYLTLAPGAGVVLDEPARTKRVYYHLASGLEAAYYVEVIAQTGEPSSVVPLIGTAPRSIEAYAYVVSALTGQILSRHNLIADAFTYRVWADPTTLMPRDTPAGNDVHPKVSTAPDGFQAPFVATDDVTLDSLPAAMFGPADPWLLAGATETSGNNVDAFVDLVTPDGFSSGDFRAATTAPGVFLNVHTPDADIRTTAARSGSIQQLFYLNNFLHDWYYDAGFTEAAGNAQTNNFGRGGLGNDSIRAEAQDFGGTNNANMLTPADGGRPRMQMYAFDSATNALHVQAPAAIAARRSIGTGQFGQQIFDLTGSLMQPSPATGCTLASFTGTAGKIVLVDREQTGGAGTCSIGTKLTHAMAAGASAFVLVNFSATPDQLLTVTGSLPTFTIPFASTTWNFAAPMKAQLAIPATVTVRLVRGIDRDGTIDNQIVAHEWFHFVSNRLIGNGSGLVTQQSIGMGEGWGDINAMMLTVRASDTATPSNATFNGTYALATYATSGGPGDLEAAGNQGYYYGIRRVPYSTDMTKNPLTFRHIANGQPITGAALAYGADGIDNAEFHNTGEVWTTMLWECYAALLRDTVGATPRLTFDQAQGRMKRYLISSLKMTPPAPTFTEARDAVLAVALESDPVDYIAFRTAFAKRGAGTHAVAPDRFSTTNAPVTEDFATGPDVGFESATVVQDPAHSCDLDGVVDSGEYGLLTVTLRNLGTTPLSATSATITSSDTNVWFPSGSALTFAPSALGATTTATLRFAYERGVAGIAVVPFEVSYTDEARAGGAQTKTVYVRTNTNVILASTATDVVEAPTAAWTASSNPIFTGTPPWERAELVTLSPLTMDHEWHADDHALAADQYLTSPVFTVDGSGSLNLQFDHDFAFEFDGGGNYDGGVVEMSVNGGAYSNISATAYTGTVFNGSGNVLGGRQAFVRTGSGHVTLTAAIAPGSTVQVRFRAASDNGIGGGGWNVDSIAFTGVVETPFATLLADPGGCTEVPLSADLAIAISSAATTVNVGATLSYTIVATNLAGDDIIGASVTSSAPSELTGCTWTCAGTTGGICTASGSGSISDRVELPLLGVATYSVVCTVAAATASTAVTTTASITLPGPLTDPVPANNTDSETDTITHNTDLAITVGSPVTSVAAGGTLVYTIAVTNLSGAGIVGATITDTFPTQLTGCTWTCAGTAGGTCTAAGSGSISDTINLPHAGFATYTAVCPVDPETASTSVTNVATVAPPSGFTDTAPANNTDSETDTITHTPANLVASKVVADNHATAPGTFKQGHFATYTIVITNTASGRQFDNPGDELTDVLPAGVTLFGASATTGEVTVTGNTVHWNGSIAALGTVTLAVTALITAAPGSLVRNQATTSFDGDGNLTNEASSLSDAYP